MRIVNVQLREQAEAAIKDKVATMHIDEVLADKQPIIEELTHRLRTVAEGSREKGAPSGLGLKIVTVQIKEAVVSSTTLWENLQKPFRAERERLARLAEVEAARQIAERELEIRQARETAEIATARELARQRALEEREAYDRRQAESERRTKVEQEAERRAMVERSATETARREAELEGLALERKLDEARAARRRAEAEAEAALVELQSQAKAVVAKREVEELRARRAVENDLTEGHVKAQMIARLPEIAAKLPAPKELRSVNISGDGAAGGPAALTGLVAGLLSLVERKPPGA
jgi:membrane protein involved in colicin uptake